MPFYRFEVDSPLPPHAVAERIRGIRRDPPGFWASIREPFGPRSAGAPPFVGTLEGDAFRFVRAIRYRNSFLPRIRGRIAAAPTGTRVYVTMHLHPAVALFMAFWLCGVGFGVVAVLMEPGGPSPAALLPAGMLAFGVILTVGGFFPEAIKARRLLERAVGSAADR